MSSKKVATYGMLIALAFIFSYVEMLIPFHFGIPGMKLGLANIVVIAALYSMGYKEAVFLSILRIFLVGFTFGNMYGILYSLAGGIMSYLVMVICKRTKLFSIIGVSVAGGVSHNIGQILVAMWVLDTSTLVYYLPVLFISGAVTGVLIGILGGSITKRINMKS